MGKKKRVFAGYRYTEADSLKEYLEQMAEKGWFFRGWKFGMLFEKGEPGCREYAVEVFEKGKLMDCGPGEQAMELGEYCRAAGWELEGGHGKFCVFRKVREDAEPIVTEEERFQSIRKAERYDLLRKLLKRGACAAALAFPLLVMCGTERAGFYAALWLFHPFLLCLLVYQAAKVLILLGRLVRLEGWLRRRKRELLEGRKPDYRIKRKGRMFSLFPEGIVVLLLAGAGTVLGYPGFGIALAGCLGIFAWQICSEYFGLSGTDRNLAEYGAVILVVLFLVMAALIGLASGRDSDLSEPAGTRIALETENGVPVKGRIRLEDQGKLEDILGSCRYVQVSYELEPEGTQEALDGTDKGRRLAGTMTAKLCESRFDWLNQWMWRMHMAKEPLIPSEEGAEAWGALRMVRQEADDGWERGMVLWKNRMLVFMTDDGKDRKLLEGLLEEAFRLAE